MLFVDYTRIPIATDDPRTTYAESHHIYRLKAGVDRSDVRRILALATTPLPRDLLVSELTRLRIATAARSTGSDEIAMLGAIFLEELARWPANHVRSALREWPRHNKFHPAISELLQDLRDRCDTLIKIGRQVGVEIDEL